MRVSWRGWGKGFICANCWPGRTSRDLGTSKAVELRDKVSPVTGRSV